MRIIVPIKQVPGDGDAPLEVQAPLVVEKINPRLAVMELGKSRHLRQVFPFDHGFPYPHQLKPLLERGHQRMMAEKMFKGLVEARDRLGVVRLDGGDVNIAESLEIEGFAVDGIVQGFQHELLLLDSDFGFQQVALFD